MEEQQSLATCKREIVNIEDYAMPVSKLVAQVSMIQNVMRDVMKNGEHYGVIPGTSGKPSLLKPGAEKLGVTFRIVPSFSEQVIDLGNGHREYRIKCSLTHAPSGQFFGEGIGSCSTMEGKYRYRTGAGESTGVQVPKSYWDKRKEDPIGAMKVLKDLANKAGFAGDKFGTKKDDAGVWMITTHGEKVEHDNPADYYNTCLKMAKKRAHVDAILTATAASDIFTQDIEDMPEIIPQVAPISSSRQSHVQQLDVPSDHDTEIKPMSEPQKKKLFAMLREHGIERDKMVEFVTWAGIVTSKAASEAFENLDSLVAEFKQGSRE